MGYVLGQTAACRYCERRRVGAGARHPPRSTLCWGGRGSVLGKGAGCRYWGGGGVDGGGGGRRRRPRGAPGRVPAVRPLSSRSRRSRPSSACERTTAASASTD